MFFSAFAAAASALDVPLFCVAGKSGWIDLLIDLLIDRPRVVDVGRNVLFYIDWAKALFPSISTGLGCFFCAPNNYSSVLAAII